jgi:hypothetical protein
MQLHNFYITIRQIQHEYEFIRAVSITIIWILQFFLRRSDSQENFHLTNFSSRMKPEIDLSIQPCIDMKEMPLASGNDGLHEIYDVLQLHGR